MIQTILGFRSPLPAQAPGSEAFQEPGGRRVLMTVATAMLVWKLLGRLRSRGYISVLPSRGERWIPFKPLSWGPALRNGKERLTRARHLYQKWVWKPRCSVGRLSK